MTRPSIVVIGHTERKSLPNVEGSGLFSVYSTTFEPSECDLVFFERALRQRDVCTEFCAGFWGEGACSQRFRCDERLRCSWVYEKAHVIIQFRIIAFKPSIQEGASSDDHCWEYENHEQVTS